MKKCIKIICNILIVSIYKLKGYLTCFKNIFFNIFKRCTVILHSTDIHNRPSLLIKFFRTFSQTAGHSRWSWNELIFNCHYTSVIENVLLNSIAIFFLYSDFVYSYSTMKILLKTRSRNFDIQNMKTSSRYFAPLYDTN